MMGLRCRTMIAAAVASLLGLGAGQAQADSPCAMCPTGCIISGECISREDSEVKAIMGIADDDDSEDSEDGDDDGDSEVADGMSFETFCSTFAGLDCSTVGEGDTQP